MIKIGNDLKIAFIMGETIANLHISFKKCEEMEMFPNKSLLDEMNGWVKKNFEINNWKYIEKEDYDNVNKVRVIHSEGFENISDRDFSLIISNPPYHTDFHVAKEFIEGSFKHLRTSGRLIMVVKRFDWYKNKIQAVFGGVKWIESEGYYIFMAEKRNEKIMKKKCSKNRKIISKKLAKKYLRY